MHKLKISIFLVLLNLLSNKTFGQYSSSEEPFAHTFSIVAFDPVSGDMGIAVQSHWFSVGNTVSWGEAGVGVIATQALVNFNYGNDGLKLLKEGKRSKEVMDILLKNDPGREMRQVAILDKFGNIAVNTGQTCVNAAGHKKGLFYSVQANFASDSTVWNKMSNAYEKHKGTMVEKMISALESAENAGGDVRGRQSASILVVRGKATGKPWLDRKIDLRVDDSDDPIGELKRLYKVHMAYQAFNHGNSALMKGNIDDADYYFNLASKLYPDNVEMTFWYAVELVNLGYLDKSIPYFKKIFDKEPSWKNVVLPKIVEAGILNVEPKILEKIKNSNN